MVKERQKYVLGIDGGGTKTTVALADLEGQILAQAESGSSNLRNLGLEKAIFNLGEGIKRVTESAAGEIVSCFIGLAAVEEEYRDKKEEIEKGLLKIVGETKVVIDSDQRVAFYSGTDEKNGVVLISGTGAVCHGWWHGKEAKASGWGWLNDEGSGFWVGQRAFQAALKSWDGRGPKTLLVDLISQQLKVSDREDLLKEIYESQDRIRSVALLSVAVDKAAQKGDRVARKILRAAGRELILSYQSVVEQLALGREEFPLVVVGKMFNSPIIWGEIQRGVRVITPRVELIKPQRPPVIGAIKLALAQAPHRSTS